MPSAFKDGPAALNYSERGRTSAMRSQHQHIQNVLKAMSAAEKFVEGARLDELDDNRKKRFALQRAFGVIGDAASQLDPSIRERYSNVPWDDLAGMRDLLTHKGFAVELEVVWTTIHDRFPEIRPHLRRILSELDLDD